MIALMKNVEVGMNAKIVRDLHHSYVDLRRDFRRFLKKFTDNIFIIFGQMVVAKTASEDVIRPLSSGVDAIEKLRPFIMNLEIPAPYMGRAVCGIVFASMEALIAHCKEQGGKSQESCNLAFLAVREFLLNIRRKTAESEQEHIMQKTGIGINDMYAIIERDRKLMAEQKDFQGSIRKRKWDSAN